MGLGEFFRMLFTQIEVIGGLFDKFITWLTDTHLLGFTFLGQDIGIKIIPINLLGVGFLGFALMLLIKALVPIA